MWATAPLREGGRGGGDISAPCREKLGPLKPSSQLNKDNNNSLIKTHFKHFFLNTPSHAGFRSIESIILK